MRYQSTSIRVTISKTTDYTKYWKDMEELELSYIAAGKWYNNFGKQVAVS